MTDFKYKYIIVIACSMLLLHFVNTAAQEKPDLSMLAPYQLKNFGKNAERSGDVYTAIDYYEAYREQKPGNLKNLYSLAKLYHNARNYEKASELYKKVYDKSPKKYILARFYYAQTLKSMGEYDQAIEEFDKFRRAFRGAKDYNTFRKLCRAEEEGCEEAKSLLDDPLKITIEDLNTTINSRHVDFAPIPVSDSSFIYSSLVVDSTKFFSVNDPSSIPVRQLYLAHKEENDWVGGERLPGPFNIEGVETGNGAFSRDGQRFYFTRCERNWQNKAICAIYVSHLEKGKWSEPVKLPPVVNDPNYTSTQPTIGTTAKYNREVIYFVSDRPEGRGGLDLWYTIWKPEKNEYTEPRNLGFKINTPGDEMTPFFDYTSRTLYFSSTGQPGLGGFDIFHTTGQLRKWTTAVNAGYPLNSSYDDLYYTISKSREDGFFVSNRPGGLTYRGKTCCDDIYYYRWKEFVKLEVTGKIYPAVKGTFNWVKDQDQLRVGTNDTVKPLEGAILALYMIDEETGEPIF
ncbi:MAG TPA: CDC27 family protein, partial [Bacteroidales bacterium]|nr:CDC27 family protein [Bacteroidales bacterium]